MTVYDTLAEAIRTHKKVSRRDMPARVAELMAKVGLLPRAMKKYPHEFSGGSVSASQSPAHSPLSRS
jgi:ABC-type glutathione transport system ATPase component